ncbi:MAG: GtrA family protein [Terracidiphilus sp.]
MNTLIRWGKFNLVGAAGVVLQLGSLEIFNHFARSHYLISTAAAIEITLLHNFAWHVRYTWRDRRDDSAWIVRLLRFHLSNGLVSFIGNVALMRVLVGHAHLPLLAANLIAIVSCSIVNFAWSDLWAFAPVRPRSA